jgi:hypothetical protein
MLQCSDRRAYRMNVDRDGTIGRCGSVSGRAIEQGFVKIS